MKRLLLFALAALLLLTACSSKGQVMDGDGMLNTYRQISQDEAKEMMLRSDGHVILDVRRQDEYDAGHIPGAILIPNESINTTPPKELPDFDQIILIYCRSGNRSKQAAQKLFDMGYTNLYEFGGINTWTGEIVTAETAPRELWSSDALPVSVRYDRMWVYSDYSEITDGARIGEIVDAVRALNVNGPTDVCVEDYTDILTFTFADGTITRLEFEDQTWVTDANERFEVEGLSRLRSLLDDILVEQTVDAMRPIPFLVIEVNGRVFTTTFEDNSSAEALREKLGGGALELQLHDYGSFEKVGELPWTLPRNDVSIVAKPGDIILYQGNQLSIYYDENTWSFTRLASLDGATKEELLDVLGDGDVTVKLRVEWTE